MPICHNASSFLGTRDLGCFNLQLAGDCAGDDIRSNLCRAQKLLALAPNDPEESDIARDSLDDESVSPSSAQTPKSATADAPTAWAPHGAGPTTCACWVGPSSKIFATGHASGEVVVWALPPEPKDAGAQARSVFVLPWAGKASLFSPYL